MVLEGVTAMQALLQALQSAISTDTMLANLTTLVPFVGGVAIFAFTYRLVKRLITGASRGKAKI